MRVKMSAARDRRVAPGLDDKILTGWNGLMIASLAKGARVLGKPTYTNAAARAADFVLDNLRRDGKLLRTYRNGQARLLGYLSDYAFLVEGLLNLYEATFDIRWIKEAVALTDESINRYFDQANGGFFFTASDGERLVVRTKNANDGAIPSGNSVQALNLLRLAILVNRSDYRVKAESIFRAFAPLVARSAVQFERMLCAVDFYYGQAKEIAIIAGPSVEATEAFLGAIYGSFLPNKVVASACEDTQLSVAAERIPLLKGKRSLGGAAAQEGLHRVVPFRDVAGVVVVDLVVVGGDHERSRSVHRLEVGIALVQGVPVPVGEYRGLLPPGTSTF